MLIKVFTRTGIGNHQAKKEQGGKNSISHQAKRRKDEKT
jgi:hypothetical protein